MWAENRRGTSWTRPDVRRPLGLRVRVEVLSRPMPDVEDVGAVEHLRVTDEGLAFGYLKACVRAACCSTRRGSMTIGGSARCAWRA